MATNAATPATPSGVSKMNAATRERKRAKDREAQRVSRERTKAYITHLETVVAELRQSSQKELGSTVEEQFKQQRKEIERLQRTVHKIARLAQSVASPSLAAESGLAAAKDAEEELEAREQDGDVRMSPPTEPRISSPHKSTSPNQQGASPAPSTPGSPFDSDAWKEKVMHGISPSDPSATSFLSSFMPNDCTMPNMFAALNGVITALQFCHGTRPTTTEAQDDDLCIRAVMFGWDSVDEKELDVVWRAIRTIDRRLYAKCRPIEKVGMLRILRAMLVKIVYTGAKTRSTIPPYMNPTELQNRKSHAPLVDLLIWPSLRDLMLAIDCTYTTQDSALQYAEVLHFDWPYDARDIYKITHTSSTISSIPNAPPTPASSTISNPSIVQRDKLYSFTHEYEQRYNDLRSWSLKAGHKCLFQRPRLSLDYCDLFGNDSNGDKRVSECCFLCDADVTTLGSGTRSKEHQEAVVAAVAAGASSGSSLGVTVGGLIDAGTVGGTARVDLGYSAALGAVYPNILLDM